MSEAVPDAIGIDLVVVKDQVTKDSNVSTTESIIAMQPDGMILQESWQQKGHEQAIVSMENDLARYTLGQIDGRYVFGSISGLGTQYAIQQAERQDEIKWLLLSKMASPSDSPQPVAQHFDFSLLGQALHFPNHSIIYYVHPHRRKKGTGLAVVAFSPVCARGAL